MIRSSTLDGYFAKPGPWQAELERLRAMLAATPLVEEIKWGQPCYSHDGGNVLILGSFKDYCALSFFKGALLEDPHHLLTQPGENTQSGRVIRLTSLEQINAMEPVLLDYVARAIANQAAGLKVDFKQSRDFSLADELIQTFAEVPGLEAAFAALTPGRQRAWNLHFTGAKQSATRKARVAKAVPNILAGKGWNER